MKIPCRNFLNFMDIFTRNQTKLDKTDIRDNLRLFFNWQFRPTKRFEQICKGMNSVVLSASTVQFFFLLFATIFACPCWPIDRMRVSATSAFLKLEDSSIFLDSQQGKVVPAHLRHVAVAWGRPKVAAKFPKWKASVLPSFSSAAAHSVCYCSPAP